MNRTSTAVYRRGRRTVFLESGGSCAKCGHAAAEAHHINGPDDDSPENLRPLCYRCHLVAPTGDAYWAWEASGESGPDRFMREFRPRVRAKMMDVGEEEFEAMYHLAMSVMLEIGPGRINGGRKNRLLSDNA